jgi:WD40 repeat protein
MLTRLSAAMAALILLSVTSPGMPQEYRALPVSGRARTAAFSPDGIVLASLVEQHSPRGALESLIMLYDASQCTETRRLELGNGVSPESIAFSPSGPLVAVGTSRILATWESSTNRFVQVTAFPAFQGFEHIPSSMAWSPDGRLLASGGIGRSAEVTLWNVDTRTAVRVLRHPNGVSVGDVAFSPISTHLATTVFAEFGDTLYLWNLQDSAEESYPGPR